MLFYGDEYSADQGAGVQNAGHFCLRCPIKPHKLSIIERREETQSHGRGGHGLPFPVCVLVVQEFLSVVGLFLRPLWGCPEHIEECVIGTCALKDIRHAGACIVLGQTLVTHRATVHFLLGAHKTAGEFKTKVAVQIVTNTIGFLQQCKLFFLNSQVNGAFLQTVEKRVVVHLQTPPE